MRHTTERSLGYLLSLQLNSKPYHQSDSACTLVPVVSMPGRENFLVATGKTEQNSLDRKFNSYLLGNKLDSGKYISIAINRLRSFYNYTKL